MKEKTLELPRFMRNIGRKRLPTPVSSHKTSSASQTPLDSDYVSDDNNGDNQQELQRRSFDLRIESYGLVLH